MPLAGGRERGAPLRDAGPSLVTEAFGPEHEVGLFADLMILHISRV